MEAKRLREGEMGQITQQQLLGHIPYAPDCPFVHGTIYPSLTSLSSSEYHSGLREWTLHNL
jgi:hypothetical protein